MCSRAEALLVQCNVFSSNQFSYIVACISILIIECWYKVQLIYTEI